MATKKEGGKNRKIGRHSRNPSSKMQAQRSAKNKAKRIAAAGKKATSHICPKYHNPKRTKVGNLLWDLVRWRGKTEMVFCA